MELGKYVGGTDYIEEVAAYIRVSTQEQKLHGISLEAQKQKLIEYAESHNMKIVEWYQDEGVSGRKLIKKRPELQRMIQDAEKRKFKRIIFIKLDRFFRSDSSRTRATGGNGLGLSIAKWIVDRHQGYFEIVSREDFGSRFTVMLPEMPLPLPAEETKGA